MTDCQHYVGPEPPLEYVPDFLKIESKSKDG